MKKNFILKNKILVLAIIIGTITGLMGVLFKFILLEGFLLISKVDDSPLLFVLMPLVLLAFIAPMRKNGLDKQNQGFGVAQVMFEIEYIQTLMMKPASVLNKTIGTILTLLAGFSVGIHGPITHIGGAAGSNIAHIFDLSDDDTRVLIGCGVAGCMAAAFQAPIFATLFVAEIIFKKRFFDMMSTILASALSGYLVARAINVQAFISVEDLTSTFSITHTPHFIALGLLMGLIAMVYVLCIKYNIKCFNTYLKSIYSRAALGSLAFAGFYALLGKDLTYGINIQNLIERLYAPHQWMLLALTLLILTSLTMASGGMGGIFSPGLYIGFSIGIAISNNHLLGLDNPIAVGLVAMAAMFSGFAMAPLTASFMIVEFTHQYHLLLPTLIATLSASTLSDFVLGQSIYHDTLSRLIYNHEKDLS